MSKLSMTPGAIYQRRKYARDRKSAEYMAKKREYGKQRMRIVRANGGGREPNAKRRERMKDPARRAARAAAHRAWRKRNPTRVAEIQRCAHLRRAYGITFAQRDERVAAQGGVCALCKGAPTGKRQRWHVDHDHETRELRGILCHRCNVNLGAYERLVESVGLPAIQRYLDGWPAPEETAEAL